MTEQRSGYYRWAELVRKEYVTVKPRKQYKKARFKKFGARLAKRWNRVYLLTLSFGNNAEGGSVC